MPHLLSSDLIAQLMTMGVSLATACPGQLQVSGICMLLLHANMIMQQPHERSPFIRPGVQAPECNLVRLCCLVCTCAC